MPADTDSGHSKLPRAPLFPSGSSWHSEVSGSHPSPKQQGKAVSQVSPARAQSERVSASVSTSTMVTESVHAVSRTPAAAKPTLQKEIVLIASANRANSED